MTVSEFGQTNIRPLRDAMHRHAPQALLAIVMLGIGLLMLSPFLWVFAVSVEPGSDQFGLPPKWIPSPISFESYELLFDQLPYSRQLLNSVLVTVVVVAVSTVLSVLSAYVFSRLRFPSRDLLFTVFLVALMIPIQVAAVPEFLVVKQLGMMDTELSVIVPALVQIFGIFLLRQHFLSIPRELEEAAELDGASRLRVLVSIIVPMSWPSISCVAILTGQYIWNDFFWPNLFLSNPLTQTAPVGLVTMQSNLAGSPAGSVFAGITLLTLPIVVVFAVLQRQLTRTLSYAGVQR
jgi:multiple sugar transport system permease protein